MEETVTRTLEEALNLIEETVNHYSVHPKKLRAVTETGDCVYIDQSSGNMCAVGRCLLNPLDAMEGQSVDQFKAFDTLDPELVKEQYRGYPFDLWDSLQNLHDNTANWSLSPLGLSKKGRAVVKRIKQRTINWYNSNKPEE